MKKIIKKILKEDRRQMFLDKIVKYMKNDFPLYKNLWDYGFYEQLSRDELKYVFSKLLGGNVERVSILDDKCSLYGEYGNEIYSENYNGKMWERYEYDENGNNIYYESSYGHWIKREYDGNGNEIYVETSDGKWFKYEYDENGNKIYHEYSNGKWIKYEYDNNGNQIYLETSDGYIEDNR